MHVDVVRVHTEAMARMRGLTQTQMVTEINNANDMISDACLWLCKKYGSDFGVDEIARIAACVSEWVMLVAEQQRRIEAD